MDQYQASDNTSPSMYSNTTDGYIINDANDSGSSMPSFPRPGAKTLTFGFLTLMIATAVWYFTATTVRLFKKTEQLSLKTELAVGRVNAYSGEVDQDYTNPFDPENQYENPYNEYKNPFRK